MLNQAYGTSPYPGGGGGGVPIDWLNVLQGAGTGFSIGAMIPAFAGGFQAQNRSQRESARSYEMVAAQLRSLLGIATGNVLTHPGNEFVGGHEDPRSRYMATGTLVGGPHGGIDPLVEKARRNLFGLLQTKGIDAKGSAALEGVGTRAVGAGLEGGRAGARGAGSARDALAALLDFGGAGQEGAGREMAIRMANRQFGRHAGTSGAGFLAGLYQAAQGALS